MEKYNVSYRRLQLFCLESCAFADDMMLFANYEKNLEKNLRIWNAEMKKQKLMLNIEKTKTMAIINKTVSAKATVEGEPIKRVNS